MDLNAFFADLINETVRKWELSARIVLAVSWHLVASRVVTARFCPHDVMFTVMASCHFVTSREVVASWHFTASKEDATRFCPHVKLSADVA